MHLMRHMQSRIQNRNGRPEGTTYRYRAAGSIVFGLRCPACTGPMRRGPVMPDMAVCGVCRTPAAIPAGHE